MAETQSPDDVHAEKTAPVEHGDINVRGILWFTAILFVALHLVCLAMYGLFQYFNVTEAEAKKSRYPLAAEDRARPLLERQPKEPRLEGFDTPLKLDMPQNSGVPGWPSAGPVQRQREEKELATPEWISDKREAVRLPIDMAMERLARKLGPASGGK